jgi:hypothetical protein
MRLVRIGRCGEDIAGYQLQMDRHANTFVVGAPAPTAVELAGVNKDCATLRSRSPARDHTRAKTIMPIMKAKVQLPPSSIPTHTAPDVLDVFRLSPPADHTCGSLGLGYAVTPMGPRT